MKRQKLSLFHVSALWILAACWWILNVGGFEEDKYLDYEDDPNISENPKGNGLVFSLKRRDGGYRVRGLLRNGTLPLHGAVKDYGYLLPYKPICFIIKTKFDVFSHFYAMITRDLSPAPPSSHPSPIAFMLGQVFLCNNATWNPATILRGHCGHWKHNNICSLHKLWQQVRPTPQGKPATVMAQSTCFIE